ncbi:hypothetical protein [Flavobacterium sp.]|uniref:hypothetical protein n=1 Tax=Flavobacterium sp. TaxID=239 RepID=UPI0031DA96EA
MNTLELHYWFNDDSHSMNAFVQNKCEHEFLGILKEIADTFEVEIIIETEPFGEGGLLRRFNIFTLSTENKNALKLTIVSALVLGIFVTPIATGVLKTTEHIIDKIFEDEELKEIEKNKSKSEIEKNNAETEKIKAETENLKLDAEAKRQKLLKSTVIKKKRSNFYEALEKDPKVNQFSIQAKNSTSTSGFEEMFIIKSNFKEFILVTDDLETEKIDNAIIEIITPVLKKGKYRWIGIYNGEPHSFNMKSNEFKTLVQTGKIEFKNGSSINCLLEVRKKINNEGVEQIAGYDIVRVNNYFENDKPIETPEGKQHRQKEEANKQQVKMNFNLD